MPKLYSSKQVISVLAKRGFIFISQKGSHAKYRKYGKVTFLRQSRLSQKDFL